MAWVRALLNKHTINESLRKHLFKKKKKKSPIGHVHSNSPEVSKETSAIEKVKSLHSPLHFHLKNLMGAITKGSFIKIYLLGTWVKFIHIYANQNSSH